MVVVYSKDPCPACVVTKNFLTERGVEFEERNITTNPEYVKEIMDLGYQAVPLVVSNNEAVSNGFEPEKLSKL